MTCHVKFPLGGRWFMLRWYHEMEGHNLILARSHAAAIATWRVRLRDSQGIEFRGYWEVDILAPSPAMHAKALASREKQALDDFWDYISWKARDWEESHKSLPPGLVRCKEFKPTDRDDAEDGNHYSCANCHTGILAAGSQEEFYRERRESIEATLQRHVDKSFCVSRAAPAVDGQKLCAASANFGHHSSGIHLGEYDPSWSGDGTIFFYIVVSELSEEEPKKMANAVRDAIKQREKLRGIEFDKQRKREEKKADQEFLALLKGSR